MTAPPDSRRARTPGARILRRAATGSLLGLALGAIVLAIAALVPHVAGPGLLGDLARLLSPDPAHGGGQASATDSGIPAGVPIGGPFALTDSSGRAVTQASFRGRWMLVYFGYSHCPDECPLTLEKVAIALRAPGPLAGIVGLTGPEPEIAKVAREYDVDFNAGDPESSGKDPVDHSTYLYLMGSDGRFENLFPESITVPQLVGVLRKAVAGAEAPVAPVAPPLYLGAPHALPAFVFRDASGRPLTLADFRGRFVLLNVWATWCAPCRREMPALDRLQAALGGPHFVVLPVSVDSDGLAAVREFYARTGIRRLGIDLDPTGSIMQALALKGVPTSFLIDPDGRQIGRETGAVAWDSPSVIAFLRRRIAASGTPTHGFGSPTAYARKREILPTARR